MQLWNDFVDWLTSDKGQPVLFFTVVLFVGIVVSGLFAAWIARGTVSGLLRRTDRQQKAAAIAALVDAAAEASVWNSLTPAEQVLSDRAVGQADIQVRLLPIKGSAAAASWATHQLADMKRNSATFGYQLDPVVVEFRDRLIAWQNKPGRAKRIFSADLERWRFESGAATPQDETQQDEWAAQQQAERPAVPASAAVGQETVAMPVAELPTAPDYLKQREQEPERYTA